MTDRAGFLRRAGLGAAAVSLGPLAGAAQAGEGVGDFPRHPRWRFVFVDHDTLSPLAIATQFGAQDACSLVGCSFKWTGSPDGGAGETVKTLKAAVAGKADGIAVTLVDDRALDGALDAARAAGIPVVAYGVDLQPASRGPRIAYVGQDHRLAGSRAGEELTGLAGGGEVGVFAPQSPTAWVQRRLAGALAGIARSGRPVKAQVVRLGEVPQEQEAGVEAYALGRKPLRGLLGVDGASTLAVGKAMRNLGLRARGKHAGGFDLLPNDLELVEEGALDFVVDQQPYLQGFVPVVQLFLARISEGLVAPSGTDTSFLIRKDNVKTFLATKSRFEGSSSRHEYPLRRV